MEEISEQSLKQQIADLESKVEELEAKYEPLPDAGVNLAKYDLNENETRVLRLVAIGLNNTEATQAAGLNPIYIANRVNQSLQFATAYSETKELFAEWQEARLKFTMIDAWNQIDDILKTDPAELIDVDSAFARTLLQVKGKIVQQLMRMNFVQESQITHKHELDKSMLQLQEGNEKLIAEELAKMMAIEASGTLKSLLPENQIIDLTPEDSDPTFAEIQRDSENRTLCFECHKYVRNIKAHVHVDHELALSTYAKKHGIEPGLLYDVT
jgi:hypothetical protein